MPKEDTSKDDKKVTETLIEKNSKPIVGETTPVDKKYIVGLAPLLVSGLALVLLAGAVGYGLSRNDRDDRMLRSSMMGGQFNTRFNQDFDDYRGGNMMGANNMRRGGYMGNRGTIDSVDSSKITIKPLQGGTTTFVIDSNTKVYNGTTEAQVSDLKSSQTVNIQPDQTDSTKAYKITID